MPRWLRAMVLGRLFWHFLSQQFCCFHVKTAKPARLQFNLSKLGNLTLRELFLFGRSETSLVKQKCEIFSIVHIPMAVTLMEHVTNIELK